MTCRFAHVIHSNPSTRVIPSSQIQQLLSQQPQPIPVLHHLPLWPYLPSLPPPPVDKDEYPHRAFDSAFDSLDIPGTQATIVNRTVPYPPTPHSAVRAFASAVLDLPPAREANYDHSWYVITIGKEVGIFCGWYVTCRSPNLIF